MSDVRPPITLSGRYADVGPNAVELARALIRVDTSTPPGRETVAATVLKEWLAAARFAHRLAWRETYAGLLDAAARVGSHVSSTADALDEVDRFVW